MTGQSKQEPWRNWMPSVHDGKALHRELLEPRYPIQALRELDSSITYRKVNTWDSLHLITPHRDTEETGWRKFSFFEVLQLLIISDLRQIGFPVDIIRYVLAQLAAFPPGMSFLDMFVISSVRGGCYTLVIDRTGRMVIPLTADSLLDKVQPDESRGPVVCCPLHNYVRRVLTLSLAEVAAQRTLQLKQPTAKEQKLLSIVADPRYERIEVVKSKDTIKTVKATSREQGKFAPDEAAKRMQAGDFREVTATTKNGGIVTIRTTDIYKL